MKALSPYFPPPLCTLNERAKIRRHLAEQILLGANGLLKAFVCLWEVPGRSWYSACLINGRAGVALHKLS